MNTTHKKKIQKFVVVFLLVLFVGVTFENDEGIVIVKAASTGTVNASKLNVRKGPDTSYSISKSGNTLVQLSKGTSVTIKKTVGKWYYVSFKFKNKSLNGYVMGTYITLKKTTTNASANTSSSTTSFEKLLSKEGFPESYKVELRKLHKSFPSWQFKSYKTNIDFNTAVTNEMKLGRSLIYDNNLNIAYKSLAEGSYNPATDKFKAYDGSKWVNASKAVIRYYMDPRNFLGKTTIYQFEDLSYNKNVQTQAGVESILKNTYMYKRKVTYTENNKKVSKYYSKLFMDAAGYSGVSPYHLASRSKQEVTIGNNKLSYSANGLLEGYKNLYNFYNIRAGQSTQYLGAVKNGLKYAKTGTTNASINKLQLIPWNTPYRAIAGGAKYIGSNYISIGQNTLYLQRFNVTPKDTYNHQYMSNVEATYSEGKRVGETYDEITNHKGMTSVFVIPIYKNLPSAKCKLPADKKNPNNYLKSLTIKNQKLSPSFKYNVYSYKLTVDAKTESIQVSATPVNSNAKVSGTGKKTLKKGDNNITIKVTAQDGSIKYYKIIVTRK